MNENELIAMSDAELLAAWRDRNDSIIREDKARASGEGYWCGTPYLNDLAWRDLIAQEMRRRGLRSPE